MSNKKKYMLSNKDIKSMLKQEVKKLRLQMNNIEIECQDNIKRGCYSNQEEADRYIEKRVYACVKGIFEGLNSIHRLKWLCSDFVSERNYFYYYVSIVHICNEFEKQYFKRYGLTIDYMVSLDSGFIVYIIDKYHLKEIYELECNILPDMEFPDFVGYWILNAK